VTRMWRRLRRGGGSAIAEPPSSARHFEGSDEELRAEIERLSEENRRARSSHTDRRLLALRHLAGIRMLDAGNDHPTYPKPDSARLPDADGLPDIAAADLTPELLRAGILRDGCLLVRGLVDREQALSFAAQIDRSFELRAAQDNGGSAEPGYFEPFVPAPGYVDLARDWIRQGGGVLAVDSPLLAYEMFEMFGDAGLPALVAGYLGEPGLITGHKTTLRKAEPSVPGAWHQDGAFMGEVRALNLWLSLSRCGDEAPGLDLLPRRLDELVTTQTDEALLSYQISQAKAEEAAGDTPIIRPIFEPGDALFFDELFLHQTGSDASMPKARFAIESWFFGSSGFPADYVPIAV
jgi:hypothetical protein